MNKKKKIQLIVLSVLLVIALAAFVGLKLYQKHAPEESDTEPSYTVLSIDPAVVEQIGITTAEGTIDLQKEAGEWKCFGETDRVLDGSLVESFLEEICQITSDTCIESVDDLTQYGLDQPIVSVTLQWAENMYTLKLGDFNSMISSYYMGVNDTSAVYTVDSSIYYTMNKTLEDFEKEE